MEPTALTAVGADRLSHDHDDDRQRRGECRRFVEAVERGEPDVAREAGRETVGGGRAAGKEGGLLQTAPQGLAKLAFGRALLRAGRAAEAWETLRRLLGDEKLRTDRPDLAYFASRARFLSRRAAAGPEPADDDESRDDLLLAWQLMDRWVRGGAGIAGRVLFDGIPALEGTDPHEAPYVPLVTEQYVKTWFEDVGLEATHDAAGIAENFLRGDVARLDAALVAAGDIAVRRPPPGEWGGAMTDDGVLGTFAQLEFGIESLVLFDALLVAREGRPAPDPQALVAAFDRFAGAELPVRLTDLRRSAAFRFLDACRRLAGGDRSAMRAVLGPAAPANAPPGAPGAAGQLRPGPLPPHASSSSAT